MRAKGKHGQSLKAAMAGLLVVLLGACSGSGATSSPSTAAPAASTPAATEGAAATPAPTPAEPVTIHWLTHNPSETAASEQTAMEWVTQYESEHPGVTVERESVTGEVLKTIATTRLQSGDVDLISYGIGPTFAGLLYDSGLLAPLDDAYAKYDWPIYDWAKLQTQSNGVTYGVPDQIEGIGLFYNADLLAELGFTEPPKTLDEFRAIAEAAKAKKLIPIAFGNKEQWESLALFSIGTATMMGGKKVDQILDGTIPWDSPEVTAVLNLFFDDFVKNGYYPKQPNGIGYDDSKALFLSGKSPFMLTYSSVSPDITEGADFNTGFVPFPGATGSAAPLAIGLGDGWFVASKSPHPEETTEFLDWILDPDRGKTQLEVFETIPAYPIDTESINVSPLYRAIIDQIGASAGQDTGHNVELLASEAVVQEMYTGFQEVIDGHKTVDDVAAALQAAFEKSR
jgi:raffinose/stachyose/melibiose transport system substrate-binding protein